MKLGTSRPQIFIPILNVLAINPGLHKSKRKRLRSLSKPSKVLWLIDYPKPQAVFSDILRADVGNMVDRAVAKLLSASVKGVHCTAHAIMLLQR